MTGSTDNGAPTPAGSPAAEHPALSVVISTFNRCRSLPIALNALAAQPAHPPFEIIIVDNNSTDRTPEVVEQWRATCPHPVRYIMEPRQGLPHARNAGIAAARGAIVAFTDDDVFVARDWVAAIVRTFELHPAVDVVGGKVLPRWAPGDPPAWFSKRLLAPLALQDKGDAPLPVHAGNASPCLIGANFAFRRAVFDRVGPFDPRYVRAQDREIQLRLWRAGGQGLYTPAIVTWVDVPRERMTKQYFRMWHRRSGRYASRMRLLDVIDRNGALVTPGSPRPIHLFGSPGYLYRQLAGHARRSATAWLTGREPAGFYDECRFWFLSSYVRERYRACAVEQQPAMRPVREVARFILAMGSRTRIL